jgi:hypothetical protein
MLVILCPGKVYFDRPSLGAPGLYVWPGSDTTFNFAAQDLSACWYPTKLHQLASGWFESAESRNASVPDDDEAAVFATVIDHLKAKSPDKRIVAMFTRTMLACRYSKRCGTAQLARLVHEHTIDSTTFNEFRLRSATQSILKPDFARSIGLHVITDQEFHYLSGEAASPIGWPARDESTDSTQFWTSFKKLNGNDASIISLTRAGFNAARTEAIVEARVVSGYSQFERATWPMMRLRKSGSTWQIEDEDVGKGVTTGEWAGGKCEPVSPTADVKWLDALKLNGEFRIVVVSTAGNLYTAKYRVHIGRNEPRMHPMREGPRNMGPFTFEAHDENGKYDEAGTLDLRFFAEGTEIPRNTDMIMLDGYHHYLTIRRITESGFAGSFTAGVFVDDGAGHFCAERIDP